MKGRYDGKYCCAAWMDGMPFEWKAGTYGEDKMPYGCLCLESFCCPCCSFYSSRHFFRDERAYAMDPTEIRVHRCIQFFHWVASFCWCLGCCFWCGGCLLKCMHPGEDADALGAASMRAGASCMRVGRIIFNGIISVQFVSFACELTGVYLFIYSQHTDVYELMTSHPTIPQNSRTTHTHTQTHTHTHTHSRTTQK